MSNPKINPHFVSLLLIRVVWKYEYGNLTQVRLAPGVTIGMCTNFTDRRESPISLDDSKAVAISLHYQRLIIDEAVLDQRINQFQSVKRFLRNLLLNAVWCVSLKSARETRIVRIEIEQVRRDVLEFGLALYVRHVTT